MHDATGRLAAPNSLWPALLFEQLGEAVLLCEPSGRILEANGAARALWGRAELAGQVLWEVEAELVGTAVATGFQRCADGHPEHAEHFSSARQRWLAYQLMRVDGLVYAFVRDVTDKKLVERRLAAVEADLRSFFELSAVGLGQYDVATGKLVRANSKLQELTGYTEAELQTLSPRDLTHPDDRAKDWSGFLAMLEGKVRIHTSEKRYMRKDGSTIWVLLAATAIRDESGKAVRTVAIQQDITHLKDTEARLREAITARDEFISVASHELRTPLTSLKLQTGVAERMIARSDHSEAHWVALGRRFELIHGQVNRLAALIDELLNVAQLRAWKSMLNLEDFDAVRLVRAVAERFEEMAERSGCTIDVVAPPALSGRWDRMRVDQVVTNLLSNALKYGAGRPVTVTVASSGEQLQLAVKDLGVGIAAEEQKRIFERFTRAAATRSYGGLGLGLYIAEQIVDAHGGSIEVDSRPGNGATFTVRLPLLAKSSVATEGSVQRAH